VSRLQQESNIIAAPQPYKAADVGRSASLELAAALVRGIGLPSSLAADTELGIPESALALSLMACPLTTTDDKRSAGWGRATGWK
jgi:hypothetical protein